MARRMEKFPRANPVADVPKRKVVKRLPDYLRPTRGAAAARVAQPEVEARSSRPRFTRACGRASCSRCGSRTSTSTAGLILVGRSHDRDIPKGGRVEAIPINSELLVVPEAAIAASPSELVFPDEDGQHAAEAHGARGGPSSRDAPRGHRHRLRPQVPAPGLRPPEPAPDANPRRCPKCKFKLFPVGEVRKIRFHHLRHTTASLLLMSGADLAAVQRIMRHQDPRITTEVYGHLAPSYLKKEIDRLSFGPAAGGRRRQRPASRRRGAAEPPLPGGRRLGAAAARRLTPPRLRLLPGYYPTPRIAHRHPRRDAGIAATGSRGLKLSGREDLNLRPFGPEPNALPGCATPRA